MKSLRFRFRDFFEERGKLSNLNRMKERTEEAEEVDPQTVRKELSTNEIEFNRLVMEFKLSQSDLREGVAREGKCRSCKEVGTLGSQVTPRFTSSHNLILQCINKGCGSDNYLLAVGEEWLNEVEEPEGGLQGDAKALYESILNACDMQVTMKKMDAKIKKLRGVLTDLTHNNSNIPNYNYIIVDAQVPSRADSSDSKIENKENADKGKATKPSRNPFKPQPPKERKRSLSESPPTTKRRERSRSRDREREPDSPTSPTPEKEVKKSPPLEMEVEVAAKEKRGRSPATDRSETTEQEEKETVRKKLKVDESVERDELQELREQNQNLMEMVKKLTLQVEQLTAQISSNAERSKDAVEMEVVSSDAGDGSATATEVDARKKKKQRKAKGGEATTVTVRPMEGLAQANPAAPTSYAAAASRSAPDPELAARQAKNQRERKRALTMFTAPPKPKVPPKEWKVMYLKWYPSEKVRKKSNCAELQHLAVRMLEQLRVRKIVKEVSIMGKHIVSLYYTAEVHDTLREALVQGKVTILNKLEPIPDIPEVQNAATNRVAFLMRRYRHNQNLSALFLQDLDTEAMRQIAIAKSGARHHD